MTTSPTLPPSLDAYFSHLSQEEQETVVRLWQAEPALRQLVQRLGAMSPGRLKLTACPACGNRRLRQTSQLDSGARTYFCAACDHNYSSTEGTPFYRLLAHSYPRLYATAVTLWGSWTPYHAWRIAGCTDTRQFTDYRRRLQPLLDELDVVPLVSRPCYRLGFSPAAQGVVCLRCGGNDLAFQKRSNPDNPSIKCADCGYGFYLVSSRRHLMPIPEDVHCPGCEGRQLNRKTQRSDGRMIYQCRDCVRTFIYPSKKFQPAKHGSNTIRPVAAGITCPACHNANIRVRKQGKDGRTTYVCGDCARLFLADPQRRGRRVATVGEGES